MKRWTHSLLVWTLSSLWWWTPAQALDVRIAGCRQPLSPSAIEAFGPLHRYAVHSVDVHVDTVFSDHVVASAHVLQHDGTRICAIGKGTDVAEACRAASQRSMRILRTAAEQGIPPPGAPSPTARWSALIPPRWRC